MKRKIWFGFEVVALAFTCGVGVVYAADTFTAKDYENMIPDNEVVEVVPTEKLHAEDLENRNGRIIVEKTVGICTDDKGNGKILNPEDPDYDYISYKSVKDVHKGDVVVTYAVYNCENNAIDDILCRTDYVVDEGQGESEELK